MKLLVRSAIALGVIATMFIHAAPAQSPEDVAKMEAALPAKATAQPTAPRKLLVFTLCKGFVHSSIPLGAKTLELMGEKTGAYTVTFSEDPAVFQPVSLAQFDAVCMLNTTGEVIEDRALKTALLEYVKSGKGLVGIHAATDCCYKWADYGAMMGGYFDGHPWGSGDTVTCKLDDPAHPLVASFKGRGFAITDEIYQFQPEPYSRDKLRVLLSLDVAMTDMNKGGIKRTDGDFAVTWVQKYGEGRVFYCSLGHNESTYWNAPVLQHYLDGIQYALGDLQADATSSAQLTPEYLQQSAATGQQTMVEHAFADLASYQTGNDPAVPQLVSDLVIGSHGDAARRADYEKRLVTMLDANPTEDARKFAIKHLYMIATDASIPVLSKLLADPATADDARYVLERMPSAAAGVVLRDQLPNATGTTLLGIVDSLGERREAEAVVLIAPLALAEDLTVAKAAAVAMGKIGGPDAEKALLTALSTAQSDRYSIFLTALLTAADTRIAQGETKEAAALYTSLLSERAPRARIAGLQGLAVVDPVAAVPAVIDALASSDAAVQRGAALAARRITSPEALQQFGASLEKLPPVSQALLVEALGESGDASVLSAIGNAVKSNDPAVSLAAVRALGKVGDQTSVELLANLSGKAQGDLQSAARTSLANLRGSDVDTAIVAAIEKADPSVRGELVRALGRRNAKGSVTALLAAAKDPDETVRAQSYVSIGELAGIEQLYPVVELLAAERSDSARQEAEKAAIAILARGGTPAENATVVLSALPDVKQGIPAYCSILRVLGKINDSVAMDALLAATQLGNSDVRITAARALAEWPTAAPALNLLELTALAQEAPLRDATLRGYLRMIELPDNTGDLKQQYVDAFAVATSVDERKLILASLGKQRDPKLIDLLTPLLEDADVKQEAALALENLKKTSLVVTASHNAGEAVKAIDGDLATRWATNEIQANGQWFAIDLGYAAEVSGVKLDATGSNGDYPREYAVYVSADGINWGEPVAKGNGDGPVTGIAFETKRARHIKIEQLGSTDGLWWSIHELVLNAN